jgi:hypothetical protein
LTTYDAALYIVFKKEKVTVVILGCMPFHEEPADFFLLVFDDEYTKTKLHHQVVLRLTGVCGTSYRQFIFKRVSRITSKIRREAIKAANLSISANRTLTALGVGV